jgi:hypothetical protein
MLVTWVLQREACLKCPIRGSCSEERKFCCTSQFAEFKSDLEVFSNRFTSDLVMVPTGFGCRFRSDIEFRLSTFSSWRLNRKTIIKEHIRNDALAHCNVKRTFSIIIKYCKADYLKHSDCQNGPRHHSSNSPSSAFMVKTRLSQLNLTHHGISDFSQTRFKATVLVTMPRLTWNVVLFDHLNDLYPANKKKRSISPEFGHSRTHRLCVALAHKEDGSLQRSGSTALVRNHCQFEEPRKVLNTIHSRELDNMLGSENSAWSP